MPDLVRLDRDHLPLIALGLVVVGMTVLLGRIAADNHNVFADEAVAIAFGRDIADDLSLAFSGSIGRGPERLTSLLVAVIAKTTDSASQELRVLHLVMALCQGLVAVPAWLAGRELGLSRWAAVLAAAIAAGGSVAVYGVFTLNQSIGLLCATILLWAMVRALRRPGLASDLLVLFGLAATVLARLGWAPLVAAMVPAVAAAAWFERPARERLGGWLRALPARLARRHPVLLPLFVVGVLAAIAVGPRELLGGQYGGVRLDPALELAVLWDNARFVFSHLAIGLALVPFILAAPALIRDLVRPADGTSGGYAWLILGMVVVFFYAYYWSIGEDRYLAVLVPPFALAGALAVFRRPPPIWSVVLSGLLTARLVVTSYAWPEQTPFDYFVAPTSLYFQRVVLGELSGLLPFSTPHVPTIAMLVALAAALIVVAVARRPQLLRPYGLVAAAVVLVGVLAFQASAAEYPARKFVDAVGLPDAADEDLSFVDRAAAGGNVQPLAVDDALRPEVSGQLVFMRAYNRTLGRGMAVLREPPSGPLVHATVARVDWRTGATVLTGASPDLLLESPGFEAVRFAGEALPPSKLFPFLQLRRVRRPLEALWLVRGDSSEGFPEGGRPLRLRVFPPTAGAACVKGAIAVHALAQRPSRYVLSGAERPMRGKAAYGAPGEFVARLPGGQPSTLVLRGTAVPLSDGRRLGPTFASLQVDSCG